MLNKESKNNDSFVENVKTMVHAVVASRIDYCNSILYRVAAVHLRPSQSVLNAAARLVLKLRNFDRFSISTTIRNELHWLNTSSQTNRLQTMPPSVQMSTRAGPNIPVVTLFAALRCHNPSSAAGGNPRRP